MKRVLFLLLILFALVLSLAFKKSTVNAFPLFGKFIILDPGHGGLDPGTTYENDCEKDYNLLFAKTLKSELEKAGATILLTRNGDYDLAAPEAAHRKKSDFDNRIKLIDDDKTDLYISLHMNYLNEPKYYGAQAFYSEKSEKNKVLAELIQAELNEYFNFNKKAKQIDNSKYMYKNINTPGVLIEYGFISNEKDRNNLKKEAYRKELSKVILKAIVNYYL